MSFTLPKLPYTYDALEPYIDARTMDIHHTKHHATYVEKLNSALAGHADLAEQPLEVTLADLENIPEDIRGAIRNHGGGHLNHSLFWPLLSPKGGGEANGDLDKAITRDFSSFAAFKEEFSKAATGHFGSGWAWLVVDQRAEALPGRPAGSAKAGLSIITTPNQDSPLMQKLTPVLGLDVWEHAYYLKYQQKRADYVAAWWNVVNWEQAGRNFDMNH